MYFFISLFFLSFFSFGGYHVGLFQLRLEVYMFFSFFSYITVHFSMLSLFKCLCWLSQFFSFDLVIFVAGNLLMFLEWMSDLLVVAGLGPIRWDSTSTDLFISSSVLFMPFCLHSYFTCIVLQRQSFSQLSFSGFFFNYILPWVSHVHTVHRVYISCHVLFYFLLIPISLISLLSAYPLYSCTSMYIPIPRSVVHQTSHGNFIDLTLCHFY